MRIRKMLISCVKLDHALYLINYGITDLCSNGIQFINEDDCRGFLFCQSKGISHHLCTITNEHLYQLRASQLQEGALRIKIVVKISVLRNEWSMRVYIHVFVLHMLWPVEFSQFLEPHTTVHL